MRIIYLSIERLTIVETSFLSAANRFIEMGTVNDMYPAIDIHEGWTDYEFNTWFARIAFNAVLDLRPLAKHPRMKFELDQPERDLAEEHADPNRS